MGLDYGEWASTRNNFMNQWNTRRHERCEDKIQKSDAKRNEDRMMQESKARKPESQGWVIPTESLFGLEKVPVCCYTPTSGIATIFGAVFVSLIGDSSDL